MSIGKEKSSSLITSMPKEGREKEKNKKLTFMMKEKKDPKATT